MRTVAPIRARERRKRRGLTAIANAASRAAENQRARAIRSQLPQPSNRETHRTKSGNDTRDTSRHNIAQDTAS
jgi:hypothetical protein